MIDLLDWAISGLSILVPGVGALGLVVKILKWVGVGGALVANPASSLLERCWDLIEWAVKGLVGYIAGKVGEAIDHICKSVPAFALLMAVAWGGYVWGGLSRPEPPSPPPAKSAPAATKKTGGGEKPSPALTDDPFAWIEKQLMGGH